MFQPFPRIVPEQRQGFIRIAKNPLVTGDRQLAGATA